MTTTQLIATIPSAAICARVQARQRVEDITSAIDDVLEALQPVDHKVAVIELHALILEGMAEDGELPATGPLPGRKEVCEAARAISEYEVYGVRSAIEDLAEMIAGMPPDWLGGGRQNLTVPAPGALPAAVRAYAQALLHEDTIRTATTAALGLLDEIETMAEVIVDDDKATPKDLGQVAQHMRRWVSEVQGDLKRLADLIRERDDR